MTTETGVPARELAERLRGPLTFAKIIRSERLCEEKTLKEFSLLLGVSISRLSDIEHGRRFVSPGTAAAWADTLGYSPEHWAQVVVQDNLDRANLPFKAKLST